MDATSEMVLPPVQPPPRSEYAGYHSSSCSRSVTREYQPLPPPQLASPSPQSQQQPFPPKVRPEGVLSLLPAAVPPPQPPQPPQLRSGGAAQPILIT